MTEAEVFAGSLQGARNDAIVWAIQEAGGQTYYLSGSDGRRPAHGEIHFADGSYCTFGFPNNAGDSCLAGVRDTDGKNFRLFR